MKASIRPAAVAATLLLTLSAAMLGCCDGTTTVHYGGGVGFISYNVDLVYENYDQENPACVYAVSTDEYFVAWQESRNAADYDIYARFYESYRAQPASSEIVICTASGDQEFPKAAYNPADGEILIVWEDYEAGDSDIWGRIVDVATGLPVAPDFPIATTIGIDELEPGATYNPDDNSYLVTWDEYTGTDIDVMGIIIEADGTAPAPEFFITPTDEDQQSAVVAYDTALDRYMVVFMDFYANPFESDLYGQIVAFDGTLIGSEFAINDEDFDQQFPVLAFNPDNNRFLIAWEDNRLSDWDSVAQELLPNGSAYDNHFLITPFSYDQRYPALSYNPDSEVYLVLWEDDSYGETYIFARMLSSAAGYLGSSTWINDYLTRSVQAAACANTNYGEFLAAWGSLEGPDYDILGQLLY